MRAPLARWSPAIARLEPGRPRERASP